MRPIIEVQGIGKRYQIGGEKEPYLSLRDELAKKLSPARRRAEAEKQDFWALKDVSFTVNEGEAVGIIGRNGAGKSTLLKILSQITPPTTGKITMRGRVGSLLEVGTGFHLELTGRENIYLNGAILGMTRKEIARKFDEIVDFAEVERFLDTPVKRYSSGMYVRLAFAVAAHLEPEILIVDEVLAVGDAQFQQKCLGKMQEVSQKGGRTVLFVSHNMAAVSSLCSKGVLIENGWTKAVGHNQVVIDQYLTKNCQNTAAFSEGPLKSLNVRQDRETIIVSAVYEVEHPLSLPALGIVISNAAGVPITGMNPRVANLKPLDQPSRKGCVTVSITHPKLLDGTYTLSAWFGDEQRDMISHLNCLSFSVAGIAGVKQLDHSDVGSVYPECKWFISAQDNGNVVNRHWERASS